MSLLDTGRDVLQVFCEVEQKTGRGNTVRVPSTTPVSAVGAVHDVSSDEANALGWDVATVKKFIGRSFPAGPWSRVVWDDRDWEVVGEPARRRRGRSTPHVSVTLHSTSLPPLPEGTTP